MLKVIVELWPLGSKEDRREISRAEIWNNTHGYTYIISEPRPFGGEPQTDEGNINDHDRKQSVWALIEKVARERMNHAD